ncbi:hypothetical protein HYPSUDRAFT_212343 [Hypholoma sublateritium FD-334 SS-4]|uniref:Letm1 RBD domain-containing protein n=1 Tax=Hypholoma sublateritium (strain FD-334 SS-4) TaxID=945553 RepID=A0A0D2PA49_HYPSF|nr:hypothetical protein HYPSUDRAFT_212343 [Hypholoma sublateritium FD-334 SS-4]
MLIRTAGGLRLQLAPCARRLYSVPVPTPIGDKQPPPPLPLPPRPKLDLRPAPRPPPPRPSVPPAPPLPARPSLGAAKEEAKHALEDAEAHGILAPPPPGATWLRRTLHQAIQIAKFYYRGTKLIFTRRGDIARIRARVAAGGAPLTRAEFRLIATQRDDITKLVPFLVIALLLEEVIPLIAIYAPGVLPSTCILPSQRARIDAKRAEKARAFAGAYAGVYAALAAQAPAGGALPRAALARRDAPIAVCGTLGLSTLGPDALRTRRIAAHLAFLARDDALLQPDTPLSRRALVDALEERGIRTAPEMTHADLHARLRAWLDAVRGADDALARRLALVVAHAASGPTPTSPPPP